MPILMVNQFHILEYATAEQTSWTVFCVGTSFFYCSSEPLNESEYLSVDKDSCLLFTHWWFFSLLVSEMSIPISCLMILTRTM